MTEHELETRLMANRPEPNTSFDIRVREHARRVTQEKNEQAEYRHFPVWKLIAGLTIIVVAVAVATVSWSTIRKNPVDSLDPHSVSNASGQALDAPEMEEEGIRLLREYAANSDCSCEGLADRLVPVHASCEDQGITLEVIAACRDDARTETFLICLTDPTTTEETWPDISEVYDPVWNSEYTSTYALIGSSADQHSWYFLIKMHYVDDNVEVETKKPVTLRVDALDHHRNSEQFLVFTGEDLLALNLPDEYDDTKGEWYHLKAAEQENALFPMPQEMEGFELAEEIQLDQICFLNGELHIQVSNWQDLTDATELWPLFLYQYRDRTVDEGTRYRRTLQYFDYKINKCVYYVETVFAFTPEEVAGVDFYVQYTVINYDRTGDWTVQFVIGEEEIQSDLVANPYEEGIGFLREFAENNAG